MLDQFQSNQIQFSREQDETEGYGQRGKLYVRTILCRH